MSGIRGNCFTLLKANKMLCQWDRDFYHGSYNSCASVLEDLEDLEEWCGDSDDLGCFMWFIAGCFFIQAASCLMS